MSSDSIPLPHTPIDALFRPSPLPQQENPVSSDTRPCGKSQCEVIDPISDARWEALVQGHPRASVFHSTAWLKTLRESYGYKPFAYAISAEGGELSSGMVFCPVKSWLTGRRLVSLPFSDHCEPLVEEPNDFQMIASRLREELMLEKWRYVEARPLGALRITGFRQRSLPAYTLHRLDLQPDLRTIFDGFHKSSTRRKIKRAEREGLIYKESSGIALLDPFYSLLAATRRRHHVPPAPKNWFRNLVNAFGRSLKIRVAFKGAQPLAAIMTICHKDTMVYKYGGTDREFNPLGGMHLLFWKTIQEAKNSKLRCFDLGRSDGDQPGLATFKRRWGADESTLTYSRYHLAAAPSLYPSETVENGWENRIAKGLLKRAPAWSLSMMGGLLYKHVG